MNRDIATHQLPDRTKEQINDGQKEECWISHTPNRSCKNKKDQVNRSLSMHKGFYHPFFRTRDVHHNNSHHHAYEKRGEVKISSDSPAEGDHTDHDEKELFTRKPSNDQRVEEKPHSESKAQVDCD